MSRLSFTPNFFFTTLDTSVSSVMSLMMISIDDAADEFFGVLVLLNRPPIPPPGCCCIEGKCVCGCELGGNGPADEFIPPGTAAVSVTGTETPPWVRLGMVEFTLFTLTPPPMLLVPP